MRTKIEYTVAEMQGQTTRAISADGDCYTLRVRRLIVNADDFGLTSGVNRAIVEAHTQGIVTSATLMANGSALQGAAQLAQSVPHMSIGCHVVLVDGKPISDKSKVPSLLDN